jgi:hypothetical protein
MSETGDITLTALDDIVFETAGQIRTTGLVALTANSDGSADVRGIFELDNGTAVGTPDASAEIFAGTLTLTAQGTNAFIGQGTNPGNAGTTGGAAAATSTNSFLEIDSTGSTTVTAQGDGDVDVSDINELLINVVDAGDGTATIQALDSINDFENGVDTNDDIIAGAIELIGGDGVGNVDRLQLETTQITITNSGDDSNVLNPAPGNATVTGLTNDAIGDIYFEQTGSTAGSGRTLSLGTASTVDGNIVITSNGNAGNTAAQDQVTVTGDVVAGGDGEITVTAATNGDVSITGQLEALDDKVTVVAADGILVEDASIDVTGGDAILTAQGGAIDSSDANGTPDITAADIVLSATSFVGEAASPLDMSTTGSSIVSVEGSVLVSVMSSTGRPAG